MHEPGRKWTASDYRFTGVNGQEKADEIFANASSAEYWMYDARVLRRWEPDPILIASLSPYATFENNPILLSDPLGASTDTNTPKGGGQKKQDPDFRQMSFLQGPAEPSNSPEYLPMKEGQLPGSSKTEAQLMTASTGGNAPQSQPNANPFNENVHSSGSISTYMPTFWDRMYGATRNNEGVFIYESLNQSYTAYNWMVNRQPYDLRGVNVGYSGAKDAAFYSIIGVSTGPISSEISSMISTINKYSRGGNVIIGETMNRVEVAGWKYNATTINVQNHLSISEMMSYNRLWILKQLREGKTILDIGIDATRVYRSVFHQMEQSMIRNYIKLHPETKALYHLIAE